jgi:hypothetical protein
MSFLTVNIDLIHGCLWSSNTATIVKLTEGFHLALEKYPSQDHDQLISITIPFLSYQTLARVSDLDDHEVEWAELFNCQTALSLTDSFKQGTEQTREEWKRFLEKEDYQKIFLSLFDDGISHLDGRLSEHSWYFRRKVM